LEYAVKKQTKPKTSPVPADAVPVKRDRAYFDALPEAELDALWADRAQHGITGNEEIVLRAVLRDKKGFKPVLVQVAICQRCNLPADNCACLNAD
jgi:hypothetical protein